MTVFHWLMIAMSMCVLAATLWQIAEDDVRNVKNFARILVCAIASVGFLSLGMSH